MSIQRLKYNVQDKLDLRPSEESSSSYTIQDESVHYKKKYVCRYFGSLIPAVLLMLIEFCIFRFDNQNGYICGPVDWYNFYWITSSKVENFPHLSSAREIHRHHCRPPALPDRRSSLSRGTASILQQYLQNYQPQQASCRPFILPEKCRVIYDARIYSFAVSNLPGLFLGI